jgi:hypothetical protein
LRKIEKYVIDGGWRTTVKSQKTNIPAYIWRCHIWVWHRHPSQNGHIGFPKICHQYPPWQIFDNNDRETPKTRNVK